MFHGTPVTKETFVAWKERFDAEMTANDCHGNKEVKLTGMVRAADIESCYYDYMLLGKQLFERDSSLVTSDMKFIEGMSSCKIVLIPFNTH